MSKKELVGTEIADFIMQRHSGAVRSLLSKPVLAIVRTNDDSVTDVYLRIKQNYASEIGASVEVFQTSEDEAVSLIKSLNERTDIHGIIIQLPLRDSSRVEELLAAVDPRKDVDGLGPNSDFDPATPTAILWLLASYNIDLRGKKVLIIGQGRLVGAPLYKMLVASEVDVVAADDTTKNLEDLCLGAQIIVTAAGSPNLVTADMVLPDAVVIDAGTSTDNGLVVGDVSDSVRDRADIVITPKKGGVGPLTVAALYENLLFAARNQQTSDKSPQTIG